MQTVMALFILGMCAVAVLLAVRDVLRERRLLLPPLLLLAEAGAIGLAFVALSSTLLLADPLIELSLRDLVTQTLPPLVAGAAGAALLWLASRYRLPRGGPNSQGYHLELLLLPALAIAALGLLLLRAPAGGAPPEITPTSQALPESTPTQEVLATEPGGVEPPIVLEDGFALASLLASPELVSASSMALGLRGDLYLGATGSILHVSAESLLSPSPELAEFAPDVPQALGLVYHDGTLYASSHGSLLALTDTDGDGRADRREAILEGLPHNVYSIHSNNGLVFDADGALYMGLGGTSDHGPETHPYAGSILRVDPASGAFDAFARGFRNPFDLTFCPDGSLFATDNGPDKTGEDLFYRPPDEVNQVLEGRNYGYPDEFGNPWPGSDTEAPIALLPISGAATGILCYRAEGAAAFPASYDGDLFVTLWGSLATQEQTGQRVLRVQLEEQGGRVRGRVSTFASGFDHPIDVLEHPDLGLLVLDYGRGEIYRIFPN